MIGANNNPLSMFVPGGGGEAFNRGLAIGDVNSAASPIAQAFQATLDRYHQTLDAQQQQQAKMQEIGAQSQATLGNEQAMVDYKRKFAAPDPDANGPKIIKDPTTGKFFYGNQTVDPTTGETKVGWTPVTNSPPTDEKKVFENSIYAGLNNQSAPNVIQQGASGSVVDTTGQQGAKPLDAQTATALLQKAGGDKNKARALAQQLGYTF